jgi:uncharacterized membrane protein
MNNDSKEITAANPRVKRIGLGVLTIYEVSEAELKQLEIGSLESVYLNFSIALLSTAVSFTVTLLTSVIASDRLYYTLVIVTAFGYIVGLLLLSMWRYTRNTSPSVVNEIRNRNPGSGVLDASVSSTALLEAPGAKPIPPQGTPGSVDS